LAKGHDFGQILTFGLSGTDPLLPMRAKFSALEQTHGIRLRAKFRLDRFIPSRTGGENPYFCRFFISALCGVVSWQQSEKVEHGRTITNLPLSNGIKIMSVLQLPHGEIGRANSDVQKRDEQTKNSTFLAALAACEFRASPNLVWL